MRMLALDVEGTIITGYNYLKATNGRFPAIIADDLQTILGIFHDADFIIVLATNTNKDNLKFYQSEFATAGFAHLINSFIPEAHDDADSKEDKLNKYSAQYHISKDNIFYFDDAPENVNRAKKAGYKNTYRITEHNVLVEQLKQLALDLNLL